MGERGPAAAVRRFLHDNELVGFALTVLAGCLVTYWIAVYLPALLVAILLAYVLNGIVDRLVRLGSPRLFAISGSMVICLLSIAMLVIIGVPELIYETTKFLGELPLWIPRFQLQVDEFLSDLPFLDRIDSGDILAGAQGWVTQIGEQMLSNSLVGVLNLFTVVVYIILIPLLLFFTLRDKDAILAWLHKFIPRSRMLGDLNEALDEQFGAYIRGKVFEGLIIFVLSLVSFLILGVEYAFVLSVAIGLSVIIPFVGAVLVTIPVVVAGLAQFGLGSDFWWLIGIYTLIQVFDGQVLVPLLFSEVVKLHPVAILVAILFFGAIWGVWGVFFAIPLASLIKSVIFVLERHLRPAPAT